MNCSCCGKGEDETEFYKIATGYRKKCKRCTKEYQKQRYHSDEEYRQSKIEYARFMNPFRDRRMIGAV